MKLQAIQKRITNLRTVGKKLPSYFGLALYALLLAIAVALGNLLQELPVGEAVLGVYAIIAFIFRIESTTTFKLALISLGAIMLLSVASPDNALTDTLAVYTYLLLVIGTVSAILETWFFERKQRKKQ